VFHRYGSRTLHLVLQWYNLFAALWAAAFISAAGDMVLAGAVAAWYWTFKKTELPKNMLGSSIKRTARCTPWHCHLKIYHDTSHHDTFI
jgi:hypothetical protein